MCIRDRAAGRVPVYFGIGAIRTQKCCRLAKMAVANGAAGVSVLQPMFLKPTYDELFQHFKTCLLYTSPRPPWTEMYWWGPTANWPGISRTCLLYTSRCV